MQTVVVPILAISLVVNIALGILFWSVLKKPTLRTRFGFYWDEDLQPHCPACQAPMQWGKWAGTHGPGLLCAKCGKPRYLADDDGNQMPIEEARRVLKEE